MKAWYVVGRDPDHVNVFGPFHTETDARAFAIDLADDNGWDSVVPMLMMHDEAQSMATDKVLWPYKEEEDE